jgi:N6-L-threonylcarbamoyladenine synthase
VSLSALRRGSRGSHLLTLAVETSCDDSAVALLDGSRVIAESVSTQEIHGAHGGVVPELASRRHLEMLPGQVSSLLSRSGVSGLGDIGVFAATAGPGLVGSLLVGLSWTKAAAWASGGRFLGINHLAAHLHTHYTGPSSVDFPAAALLVSGGHTCLFSMTSWKEFRLEGATRDDAAGEAFDKTAKLMGLGYPGGRLLDEAADRGDPLAVPLPAPLGDPSLPEFSFSGLKTAVRQRWEAGATIEDIAASFRLVVVNILVSKLLHLAGRMNAASVLVAGGVSANSLLRRVLDEKCRRLGLGLFLPPQEHATDNAVMVGRAAAAILDFNPQASSPLTCNAFARWTGDRLAALCL